MLCPIRLVSLAALKNGQDAPKTSPMISRQHDTDRAASASLLNDVLLAAHRRSRERRLLI